MAIQEIKSKINDNKQEKERKLLSTALHLFSEKGIKKTSIQDIVHDAGIAKGTFIFILKINMNYKMFCSQRHHMNFFQTRVKKPINIILIV